jgi:hypothetical protein
MATLFTITKSLGYYGSGKNREELEIDETACLFGTDLWDIVKGYAGIRGVSKTAALIKPLLDPKNIGKQVDFECERWLDMPELRDIRYDIMDWLWKDDENEEDEFRNRQNYKIHDIKQDIANEASRQYQIHGMTRNWYPALQPDYEAKAELLRIKLQELA